MRMIQITTKKLDGKEFYFVGMNHLYAHLRFNFRLPYLFSHRSKAFRKINRIDREAGSTVHCVLSCTVDHLVLNRQETNGNAPIMGWQTSLDYCLFGNAGYGYLRGRRLWEMRVKEWVLLAQECEAMGVIQALYTPTLGKVMNLLVAPEIVINIDVQ